MNIICRERIFDIVVLDNVSLTILHWRNFHENVFANSLVRVRIEIIAL